MPCQHCGIPLRPCKQAPMLPVACLSPRARRPCLCTNVLFQLVPAPEVCRTSSGSSCAADWVAMRRKASSRPEDIPRLREAVPCMAIVTRFSGAWLQNVNGFSESLWREW